LTTIWGWDFTNLELYWLVVWNIWIIFPYIGNNHPNYKYLYLGWRVLRQLFIPSQDLMDELPREAVSLKALAEVKDVEAALKRLGSSKKDIFQRPHVIPRSSWLLNFRLGFCMSLFFPNVFFGCYSPWIGIEWWFNSDLLHKMEVSKCYPRMYKPPVYK